MTTTVVRTAPGNLEQIKKQSKELLRAFRAKDPIAADRVLQNHPEFDGFATDVAMRRTLLLADAQLVVAREYGFASWPKLKHEVDRKSLETASSNGHARRGKLRHEGGRVWIEGVPIIGWGKDRECTFGGAFESATAVTEHPVSYSDMMGFTALALRTRWFQDTVTPDCCPSSPVGEFAEEIESVRNTTGWRIWAGNRLGVEQPTMAPYFSEIVSSIDDGLPVLAYVSGFDVGVIFGYIDDGERVLAYDYSQGDRELDIPAAELKPWIAFLDEHVAPPSAAETFAHSLQLAVANFRREFVPADGRPGGYEYGAAAFDAWSTDLERAAEAQGDYYAKLLHVNWWTFDALFDARKVSISYLREHADLLGEMPASLIRQAANLYEEELGLLSRTFVKRDVFFGPWNGKTVADWSSEVRKQECDLLREASSIEERAIGLLLEAIRSAGVDQPHGGRQ